MKTSTIFQSIFLFAFLFCSSSAQVWANPGSAATSTIAASHDRTAKTWDVLEWTVKNPTVRANANPFDLFATVTFVHDETKEVRVTEMFYDQHETWRFRFNASKAGTWTFVTKSGDQDLNGITGTIKVEPNPNGIGFVKGVGNKWVREVGDKGEVQAFILNAWQNFHVHPHLVHPYEDADKLQAYFDETKAHGLNAVSFLMCHNWFQFGSPSYEEHNNVNPDPKTFRLIESILERARSQGIHVHLWMWGDDSRHWGPLGLPGGTNGEEDFRVQRYLAARFSAIPGWTLGYGFDLEEWAFENNTQVWAAHLKRLMAWPHLVMGRKHHNDNLDVHSNAYFIPESFEEVVKTMEDDPYRPIFYADRFTFMRWDKVDMDWTRKAIWWNAMAGGAAGWWGFYKMSPDGVYPNPEQLKTFGDFWEGRFRLDFERDNTITDGHALHKATNDAYVFYKEGTTSIDLDLSSAVSPLKGIAVDTKTHYKEIDLGELAAEKQTWTAPYESDWAIAVGAIIDRRS